MSARNLLMSGRPRVRHFSSTATPYTPPLSPHDTVTSNPEATFHFSTQRWLQNDFWSQTAGCSQTIYATVTNESNDWCCVAHSIPAATRGTTTFGVFGYPDMEFRYAYGTPTLQINQITTMTTSFHHALPPAHLSYNVEAAYTMYFGSNPTTIVQYVMIWTHKHMAPGFYLTSPLRHTSLTISGISYNVWGNTHHTQPGFPNLILIPKNASGETTYTSALPATTDRNQNWVWTSGTINMKAVLDALVTLTVGGTKVLHATWYLFWVQYGFELRNMYTQRLNFRVYSFDVTLTRAP